MIDINALLKEVPKPKQRFVKRCPETGLYEARLPKSVREFGGAYLGHYVERIDAQEAIELALDITSRSDEFVAVMMALDSIRKGGVKIGE
jgi:hypothetical protein